MAKATVKPSLPPVTLELSGEEATVLYHYLVKELWPAEEQRQNTLNDIYDALNEAGVEMPE